MFSLSDNLQYYLCTGATDMRKGFDTLCGLVRTQMGRDPLSGEVFIFVNGPRNTIKLLHWESGGLVIYHKRLESGCFERPVFDREQNTFQMKWSELVMMIQGLSMKNLVQRKRFDPVPVRQDLRKTDSKKYTVFNLKIQCFLVKKIKKVVFFE